ncbi:RdgB/HAM1 family non-canonical purine NTP pyrophosphatase [Glacieibacterium sp.]|uniref:RdgB/HAM1 family non-canonical purine NTP pyrophosphatase n=1 Tax=Glacieibacterium sp. TaxID=2860237 RepID=UPI003B00A497
MTRRLRPGRLVLATHNPGKVREIAALLGPFGMDVVAAGDLGLPEPEETGLTFRANAELKALAAAIASGHPALADDSGLSVDALDGAPGIYSARWAGHDKDFDHAMERVHSAMAEGSPDTAYFTCALSLAWPDGAVETFEGRIDGRLVWPPRGANGFGYDALFVADGMVATFGEIDPDHKHAISHRARAFEQLVAACFL